MLRFGSTSSSRSTSVNGRENTSSGPVNWTAEYAVSPAGQWQLPGDRLLRVSCTSLAVVGTLEKGS